MELLWIAGLVALIVLVLVGALYFLQQRRSGTVRAAVTPPARQSEPDVAEDES